MTEQDHIYPRTFNVWNNLKIRQEVGMINHKGIAEENIKLKSLEKKILQTDTGSVLSSRLI